MKVWKLIQPVSLVQQVHTVVQDPQLSQDSVIQDTGVEKAPPLPKKLLAQ
jgi:hypothetical protein